MRNSFQSLLRFFRYFDSFGIPIQLTFNKSPLFKTPFGGIISLVVNGVFLFFVISQIINWVKIENSVTIYSTENFSVESLYNENRSLEYQWNKNNYALYFAIFAVFPNGTELNYHNLSRFLNISYKYAQVKDVYEVLESENCNIRATNDFLMLNYDRSTVSADESNPWRICVKDPISMGIFTSLERESVISAVLRFEITQCRTELYHFATGEECASEEEIQEVMKYITVQASIPMTIYDFKNKTKPIKRMFKYESYSIDRNLEKKYRFEINPTYLYKDFGLFGEEYSLDSIDFNPSQQTIDINLNNKNNDVLFQYDIQISYKNEKYYIKNKGIDEIIGSFGGILSILTFLGKWISFYFNSFLLTQSLLNFTFNIKNHQDEKESSKNQKNKSRLPKFVIDGKFKFSIFSMLKIRRFNKERDFFKKSQQLLYDYIDLKGIINRLHDIDKLKCILFTESQRFFFDLIQKPELNEDEIGNSLFGIDFFGEFDDKKHITTRNLINENFEKLMKVTDTGINKKIIGLLDPFVQNILNQKEEEKEKKFNFEKKRNSLYELLSDRIKTN